ncbi:MAG TPA: helix-turn-helix domain-containing protein [Candidatus Bathyarchaeia archaeon]|nr:helix-turn-helix domain-containing protein [Candidatus Bathyarchaeia archaeon]
MRRKLQKYTLSVIEVKILKTITEGSHSLYVLRKNLSIKPSFLSKNLKKLRQKDFIIVERRGPALEKSKSWKHVDLSNSKHASLMRDLLLAYNHINWENILSGLGIEVLFWILNHTEINYESFSKVAFWRYTKEFMGFGLVTLDDRGYSINPRFSVLTDFLNEYQKFWLNNLVRSISRDALILWQKGFEMLVRMPKDTNVSNGQFFKTATSCFDEFGIPIVSDFDIYFYSNVKKKIRVEDAIIHTLLIEKDNTRYVTYALLLLRKKLGTIDEDYLLREAQRVDTGLQVNAMLLFLRTKGERTGRTLPTWVEFMTRVREYEGVD